MKIIKILLVIIIVSIFLIYRNKIEGIDIIDPSPEINEDHEFFRDIQDKINDKKILVKINKSNLYFLNDNENSSLINKEIIATITPKRPTEETTCAYLHIYENNYNRQAYFPCSYGIKNIENRNNNIPSYLFTKLSDFLSNPDAKIPSKSYNILRSIFYYCRGGPESDDHPEPCRGPNYDLHYKYMLSNNLNILHIRKLDRHKRTQDFIELEIINYLDTDTNEEIKITKEKIKKYIYSQFLQ